jgi:hypothetical protein
MDFIMIKRAIRFEVGYGESPSARPTTTGGAGDDSWAWPWAAMRDETVSIFGHHPRRVRV